MLVGVKFSVLQLTRELCYDSELEFGLTTCCRIRDYLITSNVQMGATYSVGKLSATKVNKGYEAAARYINALPDEIGTPNPSKNDYGKLNLRRI
jgi:hypothetical protein